MAFARLIMSVIRLEIYFRALILYVIDLTTICESLFTMTFSSNKEVVVLIVSRIASLYQDRRQCPSKNHITDFKSIWIGPIKFIVYPIL